MIDRVLTISDTSPAAADTPAACLICEGRAAETFFEMLAVPVLCNAPCETREAARSFPRGDIQLAFCPQCGAVFNRAFRSEIMVYDQGYENSLHFSGVFQDYINELAADLVSRLDLRRKDIIEIGCGKGDFLALLCGLGENRGVGFDPTYEPERLEGAAANRIQIVPDLYSDKYGHLACDLLCCRQTLEHIAQPREFLRSIRRALGERRDTVVFFEVPNVLYTLRYKGIWDIIYEHVSYFWRLPLSRLFAESGFRVQAVREVYGGQFLCIEALPAGGTGDCEHAGMEELARVAQEARSFGETFRDQVGAVRQLLDDLKQSGKRAVVWGAGSKGVMFLNIFKDYECLYGAVDINPHKQGRFIPGSGHAVAAPEFLVVQRPDAVFLMNPHYDEEVRRQLAALSLSPELIPV